MIIIRLPEAVWTILFLNCIVWKNNFMVSGKEQEHEQEEQEHEQEEQEHEQEEQEENLKV